MHRLGLFFTVISASLLVASSGRTQAGEPLELSARRALAEARAAEAQVAKLQKAADQAQDEVERIRAQQAAAAEAIAAAEARISAADASAPDHSGSGRSAPRAAAPGAGPCDGASRRPRGHGRAPASSRDPGPGLDAGIRPRAPSARFHTARHSCPHGIPARRAQPWPPASEESGRRPHRPRRQPQRARGAQAGIRGAGGKGCKTGRETRRRSPRGRGRRARSRRGGRDADQRSSAEQLSAANCGRIFAPRTSSGPARHNEGAQSTRHLPTNSRLRRRSRKDWVPLLPTACGRGA